MSKRTSRRAAAIAVVFALAASAPAGAATTWTPVASGTTQEISAIDYRSNTQAWFATSGGQIFGADAGGAFQPQASFPGVPFTDIAFRDDGVVGLATTAGGALYRTADRGVTWRAVGLPPVRRNCTSGMSDAVVPRLNAVVWADATRAFLVGGSAATAPVVLRTNNGGATWGDANFGATCRVGETGIPLTDAYAQPGNPNVLRFLSQSFGSVYASDDGLATPATLVGSTVNTTLGLPRFAVDPANPNRMWFADHFGSECGGFCLLYSETGGASTEAMAIAGTPATSRRNLYSVRYAGGTVVAAGDGGEIYTSNDGRTAYLQRAGGGLEGVNWRAVAVANATDALVGGAGGTLVRSTNANATGDVVPPTATISGPGALTVGQTGTYTANVADEAGGSGVDPVSLVWSSADTLDESGPAASYTFLSPGSRTITVTFRDRAGNAGTASISVAVTAARAAAPPPGRRTPDGRRSGPRRGAGATPDNASRPTTQTSGGASVTLWKRIALSRGRYVPVRVSARSARRFVIEIRRARRPRTRIAMAKARLARRGAKLVRVPLRASTRTGRYRVVVRVYKGRRAIGRRVTLAFVIAR